MLIKVSFYSYFKDLTGCSQVTEELAEGSTLADLLERISVRFPKAATLQNSTLLAVGLEYQNRSYILKDNDEVSLFPPVQGG